MKRQRGITLISLIITIVILIILAGVAINFAIGENGIITKAQEAKKVQIIAEAKEKIGTEILAAQVEAVERNEQLEQTQIEDIISKYGELQADGDTIKLKDSDYEVSLKEIYSGTSTTTGSYSELKAKVALLEQQLEDSSKSQSEASKELSDLKTTLSQVTATEAQVLKDYTAYKDGKLITGTMANYAGQTVAASSTSSDDTNMYLTIPNAGYYDTNSKISTSNSNLINNYGGLIIVTKPYSYRPSAASTTLKATNTHVIDANYMTVENNMYKCLKKHKYKFILFYGYNDIAMTAKVNVNGQTIINKNVAIGINTASTYVMLDLELDVGDTFSFVMESSAVGYLRPYYIITL